MDHSHHTAPAVSSPAKLSLFERLQDTFSQYGFMPHGHCYLWKPWLVGIHVVSDFLIGVAYLSISLTLYGLVKRINLGFNRVVLCFGVFIGACGLTHFMEIWNLWNADYWWGAWVKVVTAVASVFTGLYLYKLRDPIVGVAEAAKMAELHRVKLEELLAERTEDFNAIANSIPQLAWKTDPTGYITWYNQRWYDYTGTTLVEMQGWGWQRVHHPDHEQRVTEKWQRHLATGEDWEDTFPLRRHDGEWRWFLSRARPVRGSEGNIVHWFGTNTDITEELKVKDKLDRSMIALKESEEKFKMIAEALQTSSAELESLLANSPLGLATFTSEYRYRRINPALARINGVPAADHIGKKIREVLPGDAPTVEPIIDHVFATGESVEKEVSGETPREPGKIRHWLTGFYPVKVDGKVKDVGAFVLEITDLRETEAKLRKAVSARDEFLSIASHELKTPLTALRLNTQSLLRQIAKKNPEVFEPSRVTSYIEQTFRQTDRLNRLVDDMLDISRIETGKLTVIKGPTDLAEMVREAKTRFDELFKQHGGHELKISAPESLSGNWDRVRIEQVITNLLTNALRYGEKNPVELRLSHKSDRARISVIDHGKGIAPEHREKIFERFERGGVNPNDVSGLGLGLYITRQIVVAHDGKIWIEDTPGGGATFHVELPLS